MTSIPSRAIRPRTVRQRRTAPVDRKTAIGQDGLNAVWRYEVLVEMVLVEQASIEEAVSVRLRVRIELAFVMK